MPVEQARFLGIGFEAFDREAAVAFLFDRPAGDPFFYVTTPNVDHVVRLRTERHTHEVDEAYANSDLTLCDSKVMAMLSRWHGVRLHVSSGSDITADLMERLTGSNDTLVIIGGDAQTVPALVRRYRLGGLVQHIPPMGLMNNEAALDAAARFICDHPARFVFAAVGSPQQEVIAWRAKRMGAASGICLCVGASIDYLTGRSHRAPWLFRALALEWLYRLIREPRRLWRRYLVRSPRIFALMNKDARARRRRPEK